jgi:uncharacterized Tic20 family protein
MEYALPTKPETTSEERTWAALAHISTLITLLFALPSGGLGGLLFVFVPFVIYLAYKDKSRYVAYQAAQAFALQVIATAGYLLLILISVIVTVLAWVITGVLTAILIGVILIPIAILITLIAVTAIVGVPFALGGFSIVATIQTANGDDYHYPYLGQWVANWLERQPVESGPAV